MAVVTLVRVTGEPVAVPPSGNVQLSVPPLAAVAVKVNVLPLQIGLGDAFTLVGPEIGVTVTAVVPAGEVHNPSDWVALYVPWFKLVALGIVGVAEPEINPSGPVQLKVAPACPVAFKSIVPPLQTGVLLESVGAGG